jgi:hypothetical protein
MTQDLCPTSELGEGLFCDSSWHFIPDISDECIAETTVSEAQDVAQTAAKVGPDASANIKIIAIERKFLIELLYHHDEAVAI